MATQALNLKVYVECSDAEDADLIVAQALSSDERIYLVKAEREAVLLER